MGLYALDHAMLSMPRREHDKARVFYEDVLGLKEAKKPDNDAGRGGIWFEKGALKIHLGVEQEFRPARRTYPVMLVKNIDKFQASCEDAGYTTERDNKLPGYDRFFIDDPFGNRLEIVEPMTIDIVEAKLPTFRAIYLNAFLSWISIVLVMALLVIPFMDFAGENFTVLDGLQNKAVGFWGHLTQSVSLDEHLSRLWLVLTHSAPVFLSFVLLLTVFKKSFIRFPFLPLLVGPLLTGLIVAVLLFDNVRNITPEELSFLVKMFILPTLAACFIFGVRLTIGVKRFNAHQSWSAA